ncbi:MAG TPA: hypothetical protein VMZ31_18865 [Phycisphaerae bacterium]|nr:hypothetical protein [Phycisphaerae bacterium]
MAHFQVERLRRLPQHLSETWQGGWVRLPSWVMGEDETPLRPWLPLWVSSQTEVMHAGRLCPSGQKDLAGALDALVDFACNQKLAGYRPGRLEVNSPDLATGLSDALAGLGVEVAHTEELSDLDQTAEYMREHMSGGQPDPGAMDVPGVTVERMRSFAAAAKAFYQAAPWDHLTDEDLIRIETPQCQTELGYVTVLGAGGQTYGLGFFDSPDEYWRMQESGDDPQAYYQSRKSGAWVVLFGSITELPLGDADLWEDRGLAVAGGEAYPSAFRYVPGERIERPGPAVLSFLEGLLWCLAKTTEAEIDGGRWTKQVDAFDGTVTFTLALPELLEPRKPEELIRRGIMPDRRTMERMSAQMQRYFDDHPAKDVGEMTELMNRQFVGRAMDEMEFTPRTPLEQAQDLCYQAFDARGRRQLQLVRQALKECPDCADAYVILAERSSDPRQASDLYARGVAAGERALGRKTFEQDAGRFWGLLETRPYMRARFGLAQSLAALGRPEEAVGHYQELLRLNRDDNQGVRYLLLPALIELGRDKEAADLTAESGDEDTAAWAYARALLAFRMEGAGASSTKLLQQAVKTNRHVPKYLLGNSEIPASLPGSFSLGSEEEASICAAELMDAWSGTPGAGKWLKAELRFHKPPKRRAHKKRGKRRR